MSFDIALSGIQATNEALNSTSQNIANAGTYGYKAQRANFSSLVSGELQTGVIPALASSNMTYVGNMSADWTVPATWGTVPVTGTVPITPENPPDPSTFNMSKATVIYDTLGGKHTLTQYFSRDAASPNTVNVRYLLDGAELPNNAPTTLAFNPATGALGSVDGDAAITATTIDLTGITLANGANLTKLTIDYDGSTGNSGEATTSANNAEGYASGTYTSLALGNDGSLIATYSNGQKQTVGKLALATFVNEGALTTISGTSWTESLESGRPLVNAPGTGTGGTITSSSLEQSNVDITSELVGLMTSQRNYQANSKVIQTESTMMQSLMQAI